MKTFISALLLATVCTITVQAQQKTGKATSTTVSASKEVVHRVIDVAPDGTKTTQEIYSVGTQNTTTTKVKAPKGNDVVHQEENINNGKTTILVKKLANGKTITPTVK